jgi:hypothetical protein
MNVGQRDDHALVRGEINPSNTSHLILHAPQGLAAGWRKRPYLIALFSRKSARRANGKRSGWTGSWPACRTAPQLSNEGRAYGESNAPSTGKRADARIGSEPRAGDASEGRLLHQNRRVVKVCAEPGPPSRRGSSRVGEAGRRPPGRRAAPARRATCERSHRRRSPSRSGSSRPRPRASSSARR